MHKKIDKKNVENIFELTELQKGIFYDCMRLDDPSMYVIQNLFEIKGAFDKIHFFESVKYLISKHTALRSVIRWEQIDNPVCVVLRPEEQRHINWIEAEYDEGQLEQQKDEYSNKLMKEGIKLDADCLIKFDVIHTKSKSLLFIQYHHVIIDGWSFGICIKDLFDCYKETRRGTNEVNYYNVYKQLPVHEEAISYWHNKLQGSIDKFVLPIGAESRTENLERRIIKKNIGVDTVKKIKQFCLSKNIPFSLYMYTAWSIFLSVYSGQKKVSFGVVLSGRDSSVNNILKTVGLFSNTVIWSDNLAGLTVQDVIENAIEQYSDIQKYQYTPLHIINALSANQNWIEMPETLLVLENYPLPNDTDIDIKYLETKENNSFPIIINIFDGDEVKFEFDYLCSKYNNSDIRRIADYYCEFFEHMTEQLQSPVSMLEVLPSGDIKRQLEEFNSGRRKYPINTSVGELILNIAEAMPETNALYHIETEKAMSYYELNMVSNNIASALLEKGVKKGDVVCIVLDNCIEFVPCMLGIMRCGAAFLPVNSDLPYERIKLFLEDVAPKVILTKEENNENLDFGFTVLCVEKIQHSDKIVKKFASEQDTAYLIATSGTTGVSKYVEIANRSFTDFVTWTIDKYHYKANTKSLLSLSFAFDSALLQVFPTLVSGSELFLIDPNRRREPDYYLSVLSKYDIEIIDEIPTVLNLMFQKIEQDKLYKGESLLPKLRCISLGSEYVPIVVARGCRKYLNDKADIINAYGPAETTVVVSTYEFDGWDTNEKSLIGRPRENSQIIIINEAGKLCPVGVPGEICISGECVAKGYYKNEAETSRKFINNMYSIGVEYKRLYRTGDKGRWLDSGDIEFLGRIDNQIKYHGYRMEVEGLETQIQKCLGGLNVAVSMVNQAENDSLIAFIETNREVPVNNLRKELQKYLPVYAIPSRFIFVESLPYNSNGKVDRKRLNQYVVEEEKYNESDLTGDQVTEEIRKVWISILGHSSFSNVDNFFEVGGNSISIVKLHMKLHELYPDKEITMGDMFTYSTVNQLTEYIKNFDLDQSSDRVESDSRSKEENSEHDIAIVGMACHLPKAANIDEFWENLLNGVDCIQEISEERKMLDLCYKENKSYLKWGYIEDVDKFDPLFFNISPKIATYMDPNHRLMLKTAYLALEDGGYYKTNNKEYVTGVYLGAILPTYVKHVEGVALDEVLVSNLPANMSGRISYHLGLTGPSMIFDSACSSSLVALHYASNAIRNGECDMAVVGGTYIELEHLDKAVAHTSGIVAENEKCCSFSEQAAGTIGGEGCIALVIKRKDQAIRDNDNIYAIIKGSAVKNNGNRSNGLTAPNAEIQAECIKKAWENAGINPKTISYIEAHGSATKLGDPIEMRGLQLAFESAGRDKTEKIPVGCVKTNIGHLDSVSGLAGLLKVVLCMNNRMHVPSLNFEKPNPFIEFENMPVYVQTKKEPWDNNGPLRAGVSSFGVSGTDCHMVIEEAPSKVVYPVTGRKYHVCVFSGETIEVLRRQVEIISQFLEQNKELDIRDLAYTLGIRQRKKFCKVFVAKNSKEFRDALKAWLENSINEKTLLSKRSGELKDIRVYYGNLYDNDIINSCYIKIQDKIKSERNEFIDLNIEKYIVLTQILVQLGFNDVNFQNDTFAKLVYKIIQQPDKIDVFLEGFRQNTKQVSTEKGEISTVLFGENEKLKCNITVDRIGDAKFWNYVADLIEENPDVKLDSLLQGRTIHLPNLPYDEQAYWLPLKKEEKFISKEINYEQEAEELKEKNIIHEVIWKDEDISVLEEKQELKTVVLFKSEGMRFEKMICKFRECIDNFIVVNIGDGFEEISDFEYRINYHEKDDFVRLYSAIVKRYDKVDCSFICLEGDHSFDSKRIEQVKDEISCNINLINCLCRAFLEIDQEAIWRLVFIINGASNVDELDRSIDPILSVPVALHRSINSEIENIATQVIDISEDVLETADVVNIIEKMLSSEYKESALRDGKFYYPVLKKNSLTVPRFGKKTFVDNGVYLVTGGLGGLALKIIKRLSETISANFILIGRSNTNEPEKLELLATIEENGCSIDIQTADISDEGQWKKLEKHINDNYGSINGIIHTAGIIGKKKAFLDTRWEDYDKMFQAKVYGTIAMDKALRRFNPEFTIMFSSIDAYLSMLINTPYSSANNFMQAFATYYQQLGRNIMVVSWGGWRMAGMKDNSTDEEMQDNIRDYGITTALKTGFDLEDGMKSFDVITKLNISNSFVSFIDNNDVESLRSKGFTVIDFFSQDEDTYIELNKETLMHDILEAWEATLKLSPIDFDDSFFECGGDSITAVEIMFRIQQKYKIAIPVSVIFEYGTVEEMTEYVWEKLCELHKE